MSSPPTTLGKYQIIREIARSNDIVYEAYDPIMNRRVAIKELAVPGGSTSQQREDRLRRFHREVKAAGSLSHPNIVTVYEVSEDAGRHYMAMEFLDGHTLRNEIDTKGFLPQPRAIEIAIDVLCALDFAHTNGVIHRDVKPENIQILNSGVVKLTDFGIARLTFEPNITMDGQVFGTPSYMSPEQVEGKEIDVRSDLFSVGTVFYEMLCGQKPFQGDSVVAIASAIMHKEPPPQNQIGWAAQQVINKALDKSPRERFSDAKEMIGALKALLTPDPIQPVQPPLNAPQPPQFAPTNTIMAPAPPPVIQPHTYAFPYPPQPGPSQIPVYYPPPPRQPLIKPGTALFLRRLLLTALVMGSFAALILVSVQSLSKMVQPAAARKNEPAKASPTDSVSGEATDSAPPTATTNRTQAAAALKFFELAQQFERLGRLSDAQANYEQAAVTDPNNADIQVGTADFFANMWQQSGLDRHADQAIEYYRGAIRAAGPKNDTQIRERAAQFLLDVAKDLTPNQRASARRYLYEARELAPPNSRVAQTVEDRIAEITG
ncbi:MAG: protein kinase [Chthonomonas sp.]|nr:protein kinase [Chthonomonas sp.]